MKLKKLLAARAVISKCGSERLPANVAYKFARFLRLTDGDESFFNEKFREILDNYAKKNEDGSFIRDGENGIALRPETAQDCKKEIQDLENTEIELPFRFTMQDMGCLTLSIKDCFDMDELIEEGVPECQ